MSSLTPDQLAALAGYGFVSPERYTKPFQCWLGSGKIKTGKTRFGLTFPGPIAVINFDRQIEDLIAEFPSTEVVVKSFIERIPFGTALTQAEAKALEADFARSLKMAHANPHVRTVMIDKETTLWEIPRLAEFERLSGVRARNYEAVNLRMRSYLSLYQTSGKNAYYVDDVRDEWVDDKQTGRVIRDGFKQAAGIAQVVVSFDRVGKEFSMTFEECINTSLLGTRFTGEDVNFKSLAPLVMPDVDPTVWE